MGYERPFVGVAAARSAAIADEVEALASRFVPGSRASFFDVDFTA